MARRRRVPPWWSDVRRALLCAVAVAIGCTLLLLMASLGLLRERPRYRDTLMVADGLWAGVLAAGSGVVWAFMQISTSRPDTGYRRDGLSALLALVVPGATLVNLASMALWPLIVDERAVGPNQVVAILPTAPLALVLVAAFVLAMHAWGVACALGFIRGGWRVSLAVVPAFLALIGVGAWRGTVIFSNPPSIAALVVWALVAATGLVVVLLVARVSRARPG